MESVSAVAFAQSVILKYLLSVATVSCEKTAQDGASISIKHAFHSLLTTLPVLGKKLSQIFFWKLCGIMTKKHFVTHILSESGFPETVNALLGTVD